MATDSELFVYKTTSGAKITRIPVLAFERMWVNTYLVEQNEVSYLIDSGSGFGRANHDLADGFERLVNMGGGGLEKLNWVVLTHAHIDHFGGLPYILDNSKAQVVVHELDRRILEHYEERLWLTAHRLNGFLHEAGVPDESRKELLTLYLAGKQLFHSVPVAQSFTGNDGYWGPFEVFHVPGHTAGHVLLRLDEAVFTGDHILETVSPHQAPEQLTFYTGLGHYCESLYAALDRVAGAEIFFPGHGEPLHDIRLPVQNIEAVFKERLKRVAILCEQPQTVADLSQTLFPKARGYNQLLALEETGAYVEYLNQRDVIHIANLQELEQNHHSPVIRYVCTRGNFHNKGG